ncbi:MAG: FecR family protein [Polyangiaceae bacterium]
MSAANEPEALVKALADERVPPEEPEVLAARRERLVPNVARNIREASLQREQRTRRLRWIGAVSAAASVTLAVGFGYLVLHHKAPVAAKASSDHVAALREVSGTLVVTHGGRARVVAVSDMPELLGGDELRTAADGHALLQTERSAIRVEPATQLSMLAKNPLEERIRLSVGRVNLKVSKQPQSPRSVVVETPNAEVVVHGTMFSVTVGSEQDVQVTHVRVTEGSVWVLHDGSRELVSVGNEWSSNGSAVRSVAAPAASAVAQDAPVARPVSASPAVASTPARALSVPATPAPARAASTTLGEENRMFQAAVDARNHGEEARALELFAALLARYPNGRLAEEARVERMRGLRRTGNTGAAASEARRYLAEHPHGYAQDEARGDALGGK